MVAFGNELKKKQMPNHRLHYVDYDSLKAALEEGNRASELGFLLTRPSAAKLAGAAASAPAAVRFLQLLETEITKVNDHVVTKMRYLQSAIEALLAHVQRAESNVSAVSEEWLHLENQLVELSRFIQLNLKAFRKITKKCDKLLRERASVWLSARLAQETFCQVKLEPILLKLNKIMNEVRARERPASAPTAAKQRGTEFTRKSVKYWVRAEDEVEVATRVLRHLPVLDPQNSAQNADELGQWVSSVYLDSPSFESYDARLALKEGAQLHRIRFYGLEPRQASAMFIERKKHHEKWTGGQSIKARMPIEPEKVAPFLQGRPLDMAQLCNEAVARGEITTADVPKAAQLGTEVQQAVTTQRMLPKLRTVYRRIAFQQELSSPLRVTMDSSLQLFREPPIGQSALDAVGNWCAKLSDRVDSASALRTFPHAIFEVKCAADEGTPTWVNDLIAEDLLRPVPKFSKYLTGCAVHYHTCLSSFPDWMADASLTEFAAPEGPSTGGTTSAVALPDRNVPAGPTVSATATVIAPCGPMASSSSSSPQPASEERPPVRRFGLRPRGGSGITPAPARGTVAARETLAGRRLINRGLSRADPKVFFANERTFIQWLSAGMMMLSVGIALIEFRAAQMRSDVSVVTAEVDPTTGATVGSLPSYTGSVSDYAAGILVCSMALTIQAYGLAVYLWRLRKLFRRDTSGYADMFGPPILVLAVFIAVIMYIAVHLTSGLNTQIQTNADLTSAD